MAAVESSPLFVDFLDDIFKSLNDPISLELMVDPVMTSDNITYDRSCIEEWFDVCRRGRKPVSSPVTNEALESDQLRPNVALKFVLSSTIKYLERKDAEGTLEGRGREMLDRFRESEREKLELAARKREEEQRISQLGLACPRNHVLKYFSCHRLPRSYSSRYSNGMVSVDCDLCSTRSIHAPPHNFYLHCDTCEFDVCNDCTAHADIKSRISQSPRGPVLAPAPAPAPAPTPVPRMRRFDHMVMDGSFRVLRQRQEEHQRQQQEQQQQRSSISSGVLSQMLGGLLSVNGARRGTGTPVMELCPGGHQMFRFQLGDRSPYESSLSVVCNDCRALNLSHDSFFTHCEQCSFDRCFRCSQQQQQRIPGAPPVLHTCPANHDLVPMQSTLPPGYSSVVCDVCGAGNLQRLDRPFFHCDTCQFDLCLHCL